MTSTHSILIRTLGLADYENVWKNMHTFTDTRTDATSDELWLVEHPPVFTLGQRTAPGHLLASSDIPVIQTDRGGQITYHGPGQLVAYPLIDLRRRHMGVRALVTLIETVIIQLLNIYRIEAYARSDAPGVYVKGKKTALPGELLAMGVSGGKPRFSPWEGARIDFARTDISREAAPGGISPGAAGKKTALPSDVSPETAGKKIASLGLRVRRGCSFHGLALNVDMDLTPFSYINPCGIAGLQMTQIKEWDPNVRYVDIQDQISQLFSEALRALTIR